ncbi:pectate lyase [Biscogniauxia mediterranea]|nr:pectate lyase [Biscogniauxia mediterranea]
MKFSAAIALLATSVVAAPTPTEDQPLDARTVQKRASITDAADIGYASQNGGTTGGAGGTTTTVSDLASFTAAATSDEKMVIAVSGAITGDTKVRVASDKTIVGLAGSSIKGVGLTVKGVSNVILRNLKISEVLAAQGDAVTIQEATNVWADHLDLSSNLDHDKDYYDGLLDVTHAAEWVTISNSYFHDHWKASLVGHSDSNADEDTGHLHVTYANNHWSNINSRTPSFRFGTGHIFNSYYESIIDSGINTRMGAQLLIESTVFANSSDKAILSQDSDETGYAVVNDVDLGGSTNSAPEGTLTSVPYDYTLLGSANVKAAVAGVAGQTLTF